ncbi:MAG: amino acid ABC transporter permease [Actinomycetes bacterium]|jgi:polar amino acid transport system permease protein|nr:MAG: ABC transporter permease [Actinomycetota bacterium]
MALNERRVGSLTRGTVIAWVVTIVIVALVVAFADWERIGSNFFNVDEARRMLPQLLTVAAKNTLVYTVASFCFGFVIALCMALMRLSNFPPARAFALAYVELFRGLPALVTLILLAFGIPIAFPGVRIPGGQVGAAITGLSIVAGAYMAETIRGGIEAVPRGQMEAARSLGMSRGQTMASIIIPQAFRIMIPPLTNEFVLLIKDTSLIYVVGSTPATRELVKFARDFMSDRRNATPLTVIAIVYLLITLPLTYLVRRLEERLGKGR